MTFKDNISERLKSVLNVILYIKGKNYYTSSELQIILTKINELAKLLVKDE